MADRRVIGGVVATVVVAVAVVAVVVALAPKAPSAVTHAPAASQAGDRASTSTSTRASATARGPATFAGPDGTQASWVIQENDKPGTTAWEIHGSHGGITGFANQVYAQQGQQVTLYVSTTGPSFRAEAFRMGYYQNKGARLIWTSAQVKGKNQPGCPTTGGTNMVACDNWSPSLTFTVTSAWVQGDYLIKLAGPGNRQSYIPLTIWAPASTAAYVIKNDVFTWQAWNFYGGYDYYQGLGSCPADVYPLCSRSRVVSYDRPYAAENGSGNFLDLEYPLVKWAEQHGLDVTYATDLTVQEHPGYLLKHKVLLSLGHDECWSYGEREAAVTAYNQGMNIVFFAASPVLRHVRTQASPLGADRELVDYRDSAADPLDGHGNAMEVTGNEWSNAPSSWPEYDFVGDTYSGFLEPGLHAGFKVADASAWAFDGTGLHNGDVVPGVVASDVDQFEEADGQPANDQILGHSPVSASEGQSNTTPWFSDMTYYTDAQTGAGVIDTGTNNWIPALDGHSGCYSGGLCEDTIVQRITGNIFKLFGQGPAAKLQPSAANWQQVTGQ